MFEGSEKIIDVSLQAGARGLRERPLVFWQTLVASCGAEILSVEHHDTCIAFILSESSLFVWDHRVRMLTCGETSLSPCLIKLIETLGQSQVAVASYQRKNEYRYQASLASFDQELSLLRQVIDGKGYRVGHIDSHHHYLFLAYGDNHHGAAPATYELLMHHLDADVTERLRQSSITKLQVRTLLNFQTLLPEFTLDDHLFTPFGYSVNGVYQQEYFTVHITPQVNHSYVSFETNIMSPQKLKQLTAAMLSLFKPESWDVIAVNQQPVEHHVAEASHSTCSIVSEQHDTVQFNHYQRNDIRLCCETL
ncbi:adenosylmethionine decarboxylase [Shewanella waksmanii]|uniref:adenosylmethionine decarboxylase n=1 Tax=Shewanella waksmanii TaxID=213783 RepID=UPI0037369EAD